MIGYLKGEVIYLESNSVIVNVNDVGYQIELAGWQPSLGEIIEVYTFTHVRENELKLFGFRNHSDLEWFEILIEINGVGPKVALGLLGEIGTQKILTAVITNDPVHLKSKGIGKKTAEKIIFSLKRKIDSLPGASQKEPQLTKNENLYYDAMQALEGLGYTEKEIERAMKEVNEEYDEVAALVKTLLKTLSSKPR